MSEHDIILFDGECGLCERWVRFVIRRDEHQRFLLAASQSETGKRLIEQKGWQELVTQTVILLQEDRVLTESEAALEIARNLRSPWNWAYGLKIVPRFIRDRLYRLVARNRHRWFGETASCQIDQGDSASRFLK